jgi:hypothetical protein
MLQAFGLQHGWSNMPRSGMLLYDARLRSDPEKEKEVSRRRHETFSGHNEKDAVGMTYLGMIRYLIRK